MRFRIWGTGGKRGCTSARPQGRLAGDAGRFDQIIDVASAIWSCEYNGYSPGVPVAVLEAIDWPKTDSAEVERLSRIWMDLDDPPDAEDER
jgi:hypothetical protein